ncbi:MAG: methyltransferase domain-containing protein [Synergistaceae bacterium]|jgi:phospholipid N-methyltransferase|nr:methyltransferase domain-containing protein [Synergistaceae bacterium]
MGINGENHVNGLSNFARSTKRHIDQQLLLLKELIKNPRDMGTISASSSALASAMVSDLSPGFIESGLFVELGAGTGPVTLALLKRGIPVNRLLVFEKSESLANCLSKRFPEARVLCRGAEEMSQCVEKGEYVKAVISSLPFRTLPVDVSRAIMSEIERTLAPGGLYIQFTYALIGEMPFVPPSFRKVRSKFVLFNVPPAKVEVFCKPGIVGSV